MRGAEGERGLGQSEKPLLGQEGGERSSFTPAHPTVVTYHFRFTSDQAFTEVQVNTLNSMGIIDGNWCAGSRESGLV